MLKIYYVLSVILKSFINRDDLWDVIDVIYIYAIARELMNLDKFTTVMFACFTPNFDIGAT